MLLVGDGQLLADFYADPTIRRGLTRHRVTISANMDSHGTVLRRWPRFR